LSVPAPAGVAIRRATSADVDGIVSVLWDVGAEGRWIGTEVPFDRVARAAAVAERLVGPDDLWLVADVDANVVGHLVLGIAPYGTAELGMALLPPWRGVGIGSALLAQGVDWARDAGALKIALELWPGNDAALALYRRMGFVEEGRKRRHYRRRSGEVWDSILMGLRLDGPPWSVRPATDDDGWDLVALVAACWSEYPGCVMDPHGECADLLAPATALAGNGGAIWVAEGPGDEVIASVALGPPAARTAELQKLYVGRRWRRRGLATHLMGVAETEARRRGATGIELWSDSRFVHAHGLYGARGYKATGASRELGDLSSSVEMHFTRAL
jgi:GNAT superfamily N-acetyltransferase